MTAKEYLLQYRRLMIRIKCIEQDLEDLRQQRSSITIDLDGMPKGSAISDKTARLATLLADIESELIAKRSEAWSVRMEITNTIDRLSDPAQARLLHLRYIYGWTWERIAVDMGYTYQWVAGSLHGQALQSMEKIIH